MGLEETYIIIGSILVILNLIFQTNRIITNEDYRNKTDMVIIYFNYTLLSVCIFFFGPILLLCGIVVYLLVYIPVKVLDLIRTKSLRKIF